MSQDKYCDEGRSLNIEHGKAADEVVLARSDVERESESVEQLSSFGEREQRLRSAEAAANESAKRWDEHFWHCPICSDAR